MIKTKVSINWSSQIDTYPEASLDVLIGRHLGEASLEEDLPTQNIILVPNSPSKPLDLSLLKPPLKSRIN